MYAVMRPLLGVHAHTSLPYRAFVVFKWAVRVLVLDYTLTTFLLLDLPRGIAVWRSAGFALHVGAVALIVLTALLAPCLPRGARRGEGKKAAKQL